MMQNNWMMPWMNFWANKAGESAPLGGDVSQLFNMFSPTIEVRGEGDPVLERQIVLDVATYGKQLGELTDVVLQLAEKIGLAQSQALGEVQTIAARVAETKAEFRKNTLERARKALEDLRDHDPAGYDLLVAGLEARR